MPSSSRGSALLGNLSLADPARRRSSHWRLPVPGVGPRIRFRLTGDPNETISSHSTVIRQGVSSLIRRRTSGSSFPACIGRSASALAERRKSAPPSARQCRRSSGASPRRGSHWPSRPMGFVGQGASGEGIRGLGQQLPTAIARNCRVDDLYLPPASRAWATRGDGARGELASAQSTFRSFSGSEALSRLKAALT